MRHFDPLKHRRLMALIALALVLSLALTTVFALAEGEAQAEADTNPFASSPGGLVAFIAVLAGVVLGLALQRIRASRKNQHDKKLRR